MYSFDIHIYIGSFLYSLDIYIMSSFYYFTYIFGLSNISLFIFHCSYFCSYFCSYILSFFRFVEHRVKKAFNRTLFMFYHLKPWMLELCVLLIILFQGKRGLDGKDGIPGRPGLTVSIDSCCCCCPIRKSAVNLIGNGLWTKCFINIVLYIKVL